MYYYTCSVAIIRFVQPLVCYRKISDIVKSLTRGIGCGTKNLGMFPADVAVHGAFWCE